MARSWAYVSGYADEDYTKPGVYRVEVPSGNVKKLDNRYVRGKAYVTGDRVVVVGTGALEKGSAAHGPLVLTGARDGDALSQTSCLADKSSLHSIALAGDTVLLSLFQSSTGTAAIAKLPLR